MQPVNVPALPRIGGLATIPSRKAGLAAVLARVLPQLDHLYVFFDRHGEVPAEYAAHPKITALLPSTAGDFRSCGKFLGVELHRTPCLYFGFDDDIQYPSDHVDVLARALHRYNLRAVVGFHATLFTPPHQSYLRDRVILNFGQALNIDCCADELGSGTIAFHTGTIRFHPRSWPYRNMSDLMLAIEAVNRGLPRITVRRPDGYVRPLAEYQADSLYIQLHRDDSRETALMRKAIERFPLAWQRAGPNAEHWLGDSPSRSATG